MLIYNSNKNAMIIQLDYNQQGRPCVWIVDNLHGCGRHHDHYGHKES
jgi:hypothetical protein